MATSTWKRLAQGWILLRSTSSLDRPSLASMSGSSPALKSSKSKGKGKPASAVKPKPAGKPEDERLLQEILSLGGTNDDLDLIDGHSEDDDEDAAIPDVSQALLELRPRVLASHFNFDDFSRQSYPTM